MTKSLEREMTSVWSCPALKNPNLTDAMSFFKTGFGRRAKKIWRLNATRGCVMSGGQGACFACRLGGCGGECL